MAEITKDDGPESTHGRPRPPIYDISHWVERFTLMAGVLASRFPDKAPDFWPCPGPNETSNLGPGLPTTGNTAGKPSRGKISAGLEQTPPYTARHSPSELKPYQGANIAFKRTTQPPTAQVTPAEQRSAGSLTRLQRPPRTGKTHLTPSPPPGGTPRSRYASILISNGKKATHACQACWGNHTVTRCSQRGTGYNRPRSPRQSLPPPPPNQYVQKRY